MVLPHLTPIYEKWAPVAARVIFGGIFLMSAFFKIPGTEMFQMQVEMSAQAGIPLPLVAVFLAFVLEVVAGIALVVGWQTRTAAASLIVFTVLIALFFFRNLADQAQFVSFMGCVQLIAGLLYVSVYGAQSMAVKTCTLPKGLVKIKVTEAE